MATHLARDPRQKPIALEADLHAAVATFLTLSLPHDVWFTTFPAGGGGRIRGAKLKSSGLKSGVPDIILVHKGRLFGIELKTARGSLSPAQTHCHEQLTKAGALVRVCRSLDDVALALFHWAIPTMARVA